MEDGSFRISNNSRSPVPAVGKAVRILDSLSSEHRPIGISEIARRTGLSKGTAHAVAGALVAEGLLDLDGSGRGYLLGGRLAGLGAAARDHRILFRAQRVLDDLAARNHETVLFGRLEGDGVRILARASGDRPLTLSASVGSSVPVMAGALGKTLLASVGLERAEKNLAAKPLPSHHGAVPLTPERYRREVDRARKDGFAVERGEYLPGVAAVAAMFQSLSATYFLWTVGIEANLGRADLDRLGLSLVEAVRRLESELHAGRNDEADGVLDASAS